MTLNSNNPKKSSDVIKLKDIFKGMLTLGGGKEEGINFFPSSTDGVLGALAPWIAILVVVSGFKLFSAFQTNKAHQLIVISSFLFRLCTILLIPFFIHFFSVYWKKEAFWKRTVAGYCWCQWMPVFDLMIGVMVVSLLAFSPSIFFGFIAVLMVLYIAYMIWISWITVKAGLQVNNKQSLMVVASIIASDIILFFILLICNADVFVKTFQELPVAH